MQTVVSKGEYAAMKGRAPSAISNWIADGRISRAALVGEGVRAKIWVEQADADLSRNLDPSQQVAQERPVSPGLDPGAPPTPDDEDLRRRRKADADRAEHDAAMALLKRNREEGRWIDAEAAAQAWGKELAEIMTTTETFVVSVLPREIGDAFGLAPAEVAAVIRKLWHDRRSRAADSAAAREAEIAQQGE